MTIEDLDKTANRLIQDYQQTYLYILSRLEYQIENGLSEQHSRAILREIQLELMRLDEQAYKWSNEVLPEYYYLTFGEIDRDVAKLRGLNVIQGQQAVIHKKAIEVASKSLYTDLARNTQYMSQQAKQIIRVNGKELISRQVISGESQRKTKRDLIKALKTDGVTSFIDAGKKNWTIENYSSMAIRTKSRLIHNEGLENRLSEYREIYPNSENFDLIQISSHGSNCWCGLYEGTVWSISGNHPDYPSVDQLPNYPYKSFHPNCKHVWKPYIIELRGQGKTVSNDYLNRTIKDLNKEHYHKHK
ncbi:phage minor capsid protein [Oceanobacillus caeni]|uniref:phage minor capsid protein n=1 Tax=Virgibacillus sp. SK37 TaxID=403957 RepID=UPI0011A97BC7|nr:phage minor capsid protein [Virgibacillus sp. SK37]